MTRSPGSTPCRREGWRSESYGPIRARTSGPGVGLLDEHAVRRSAKSSSSRSTSRACAECIKSEAVKIREIVDIAALGPELIDPCVEIRIAQRDPADHGMVGRDGQVSPHDRRIFGDRRLCACVEPVSSRRKQHRLDETAEIEPAADFQPLVDGTDETDGRTERNYNWSRVAPSSAPFRNARCRAYRKGPSRKPAGATDMGRIARRYNICSRADARFVGEIGGLDVATQPEQRLVGQGMPRSRAAGSSRSVHWPRPSESRERFSH